MIYIGVDPGGKTGIFVYNSAKRGVWDSHEMHAARAVDHLTALINSLIDDDGGVGRVHVSVEK